MRRISLSLLGGLVLAVLPAATAYAATPSCGSTVTTSVTFTKDLVCPGNGLTVHASGIVINLNGHQLLGRNAGAGITVDESFRNIVIENGAVSSFGSGVELRGDGVHIVNVRVRHNFTGIGCDAGPTSAEELLNEISGGTVAFNRTGIFMGTEDEEEGDANQCPYSSIRNVFIHHNTDAGISGIGGFVRSLTGNTFEANFDGVNAFLFADIGTVSGNTVVNNTHDGMLLDSVGLFENNFVRGNGRYGLDIAESEGQNQKIRHNTFKQNLIGVLLEGALGPTVSDNSFIDNGAAGLSGSTFSLRDFNRPSITDNRFTGNGFAPNGRTENDGLNVRTAFSSQPPIVARNTATSNADYGIEAPDGADGGGNRASGNGNPAQCLGVTCGKA